MATSPLAAAKHKSCAMAAQGAAHCLLGTEFDCIVSISVLPEALGIASHLFNSQSVGRYRLEIPLTWIIVENTNSYLWVVAGKGMWRTDRD